jgi:hypothetical protein
MLKCSDGKYRNIDLFSRSKGQLEVLSMIVVVKVIILEEIRTVAINECAAMSGRD